MGLPVLSVLVSLLAIRNAGVDTWGAFVGAMVLVNLCAQVADFGSRDALVRAFSREPGAMTVAWRTAAASRVPLLVVGPIVFVIAGSEPVAVALMVMWLLGQFTARLHDGLVAYRRAFAYSLGVEVSAVGLTLAAVALSGRAISVTLLLAAFTIAAWLRAAAMIRRFDALRPGPGWVASWAELRRSWPFFGLTFSGAVQSRVDLYVVAALLPAPMLGTYQVLTSFVLLGQSLAGALLGPIVPALYRLSRSGVLRGTRRLAFAGLAVATLGIAGTSVALDRLYGLSVPPGGLLAAWVAMLPAFAYLPLVHLAFRDGDERIVLAANLAGLGVAGVGALVLVPVLGLTGAMLASAAAQVAILALHLVRTVRRPDGSVAAGDPAMELLDALPDV